MPNVTSATIVQGNRVVAVMHHHRKLSLIGLLAHAGVLATCSTAAEISLRTVATPGDTVVRLRDIAEVRSASGELDEELAKFPLMPTPAPGTKQYLSLRQVRDMLRAAGIPVSAHRFTGAAQVSVVGEVPEALRQRVGRMTSVQLARVDDDLKAAISSYLDRAATDTAWQVDISLSDAQRRQLAEASIPWTIAGATEPWTGRQLLTVQYETPGGKGSVQIEAEVSLPDPVIVVSRALSRGTLIGQADVALIRPTNEFDMRSTRGVFHELNDVVGRVTRRSLSEGQVLTTSMIEEPTLVRSGQTVRVIALARGIRVTTTARARQSGVRGELIYVEPLDRREPYPALVSGLREVQVIGR